MDAAKCKPAGLGCGCNDELSQQLSEIAQQFLAVWAGVNILVLLSVVEENRV